MFHGICCLQPFRHWQKNARPVQETPVDLSCPNRAKQPDKGSEEHTAEETRPEQNFTPSEMDFMGLAGPAERDSVLSREAPLAVNINFWYWYFLEQQQQFLHQWLQQNVNYVGKDG